jgi:hypothetical protein
MKKPKLPKKDKATKPTKAAGSNSVDPEKRALFLSDKEAFHKASVRLKKAQAAVRTLGKTIKADGFSLRQVKLAIQLETPEGEAEFKSSVANDLLAAQYVGAAIGSQLSMFMEPDRTPAVDVAADEGQKDAIEHKAAKPKYDPSTPQFKSYMEAYAAEQGRQVKAGIGKLETMN